MMKVFFSYVSFIHKLILKKKNTIIIPLLWLTISIILTIVINSIELDSKLVPLIYYIVVFIESLLTVLFASIKSINIYKDLEEEGIELLTLSKPISRNKVIWGKTFTNFLLGFYWSIIMFLCNVIILSGISNSDVVFISFVSIPVFTIVYILFGSVSSLIAYKMNAKLAITAPLVIFSPLVIAGTIVSSKSTSASNNIAYYLNAKYNNHTSGNVPNLEKFYLNNNVDSLYIIPNGYNKTGYRKDQIEYLKKAFEYSKNSAYDWQIYSYLSLPYQIVDYFNVENKNISEIFGNNTINNLKDYLYYNNKDTFTYNYDLNNDVILKKYSITDIAMKKKDANGNVIKDQNGVDIIDSRSNKKVFLVPGALKSYSHIDNLVNTDIVYARDNAESFKVTFPEDKFVYSASDNLVGQLKWVYIKELLENEVFNYYAKLFANDLLKTLDNEVNKENKEDILDKILRNIEELLNDNNYELLKINDISSIVLNSSSLNNKKIKTLTEKKIYLATAFIYYLYFTFNDSYIVDALLYNLATENEDPHSYSVKIDGFQYNIGGYASYTPKQEIQTVNDTKSDNNKERRVIIRYNLQPSNNYLFQPLEEVYQVSRNKNTTVNKNYYFIIWIVLGITFVLLNNRFYIKKDYR
ncbi:ABC transporter permease [Mycoplasmopsis cynos]|uniref:ABC transporter permease n=1 Tax=Mycoplasmopsis cynos TaxID=171284 RepID=UPI002AFF2110|nr:ABC transporter permease [Mycoplasmopsis cynos]WQQ15506.1 ABC transporter permease [Mycoplasmopsis cynos]